MHGYLFFEGLLQFHPNYRCSLHSSSILLIVCRKYLNQSDYTDCKIITIEGEEKAFLVGSPDHCQCFEFNRN
jgi:hypothetical protein